MNYIKLVINSLLVLVILGLIGCASSQESSSEQKEQTPQPTIQKPSEQAPTPVTKPAGRVDTVDVKMQSEQKPPYEPTTPPLPSTTGKYTVQIGAYKMQDNAERIASLAKERFNQNVYTYLDKASNLFKVMIGNFMTKEDARKFRDEMGQRFPIDYKDAWVSEIVQQ